MLPLICDDLRHRTIPPPVTRHPQVVFGHDYPDDVIRHLGHLFDAWSRGFMAWPYINLPFTTFGRALAAKEELYAFYRAEVEEARGRLERGEAVEGIVGSFLTSVDEDGAK